jgi:hypothetical protein
LQRLGLDADDLDIHKPNTIMAQRAMTTDERVALKTALHRAGCID